MDALRAIFTPEIQKRLRSCRNPSPLLINRLEALSASGPYPSDPVAAHRIRWLRARRSAWDVYLSAALACGLFDGEHGNDLKARLTGTDDEGFRSAIAECLVCWLLGGPLKLPLQPRPPGRNGKVLELRASHAGGEISVEVKAPYRERPVETWGGDDSALIADCLDRANKQFREGTRNVLFLVPELRISAFALRSQVISAFFGREKITIPIDTRTGGPAGPLEVKFFPEGKFLNQRLPDGRFLKPDGSPAFTRVSAVVCVEERYEEVGWISHRMLVVHNPYSKHPVPPELWGDCPQFLLKDGGLRWTDGHPLSR